MRCDDEEAVAGRVGRQHLAADGWVHEERLGSVGAKQRHAGQSGRLAVVDVGDAGQRGQRRRSRDAAVAGDVVGRRALGRARGDADGCGQIAHGARGDGHADRHAQLRQGWHAAEIAGHGGAAVHAGAAGAGKAGAVRQGQRQDRVRGRQRRFVTQGDVIARSFAIDEDQRRRRDADSQIGVGLRVLGRLDDGHGREGAAAAPGGAGRSRRVVHEAGEDGELAAGLAAHDVGPMHGEDAGRGVIHDQLGKRGGAQAVGIARHVQRRDGEGGLARRPTVDAGADAVVVNGAPVERAAAQGQCFDVETIRAGGQTESRICPGANAAPQVLVEVVVGAARAGASKEGWVRAVQVSLNDQRVLVGATEVADAGVVTSQVAPLAALAEVESAIRLVHDYIANLHQRQPAADIARVGRNTVNDLGQAAVQVGPPQLVTFGPVELVADRVEGDLQGLRAIGGQAADHLLCAAAIQIGAPDAGRLGVVALEHLSPVDLAVALVYGDVENDLA